MRIITVGTLRAFWEKYPDAQQALKAWHDDAERASWQTPTDIKAQYASASILPDNRVVFNIRGNDYRLVVKIHYNTDFVFVRFVGTHEDYARVNAEMV